MITLIISAIVSLLGIISTLIAWNLNPKRKLYAELDSIFKQLDQLYKERDEALAKNDSDSLTIITASIVKLCQRKAYIFQQYG